MARPKKDDARTIIYKVRLNESENRMLTEASKNTSSAKSEVFRNALKEYHRATAPAYISSHNEETEISPDICNLRLEDLQPSQFYISNRKLQDINEWFRPEDLANFEPIPVKMLDGIPVMTDGHTRAVAAVLAGLERVPLVWDEDELSWDMYRRCVQECKTRGIQNPADLVNRIISESEYRKKWDAWCNKMQAEVVRSRIVIEENELTDELLVTLIKFSSDWEAENSCHGYRKNEKADIEGNRIFVAKVDNEVIGYLFGQKEASEKATSIMPAGTSVFEVEELYVKPDYRRKGIGKMLFSYAEQAVKTDVNYIMLSTATKNWKAILHFYLEELGMEFWSARLFKKVNVDDNTL